MWLIRNQSNTNITHIKICHEFPSVMRAYKKQLTNIGHLMGKELFKNENIDDNFVRAEKDNNLAK